MPNKSIILKFGSSVLRTPGDLHVAVDEVYRHWRAGFRVLAVVSAFEGVTDILLGEVAESLGSDSFEATAAYVATGEQQTAALLLGSLQQYGLPARLVGPQDIGLIAEGPILESTPSSVDPAAIERLWNKHPVLVLPGYFAHDHEGYTVLFGRGGSDLSAIFLAAELDAGCRLLKDVAGVFDTDPKRTPGAHRFSALSWDRSMQVAGPLIQAKALQYAQLRGLRFEVGRANEAACTVVGSAEDDWAPAGRQSRPLEVALIGCGVVGRGVYKTLRRYSETFELAHVVVRNKEHYPDIDCLTTDSAVAFEEDIDIVIICTSGGDSSFHLIASGLEAGKFVVTANKAALAAYGEVLLRYATGPSKRLWYSAAVGGAMPALETIAILKGKVRELRGILNGTCGAVLELLSQGKTRLEAITEAQDKGFAEADPTRDLSGRDTCDKLALLVGAAYDEWIEPKSIPTVGIDSIDSVPKGYQLVARARQAARGLTLSVAPEVLPPANFLAQAKGAENRLEIELESGEVIQLRGQGAGRWPTTASIMGDLHEIARFFELQRTER